MIEIYISTYMYRIAIDNLIQLLCNIKFNIYLYIFDLNQNSFIFNASTLFFRQIIICISLENRFVNLSITIYNFPLII